MNELFKYPNVVFVAKGHKIIGGNDTGRPAVVIGVEKKIPRALLKGDQVLPCYYDGKITDVVEVGHIRALQRTDKVRPAPGGVSIGHYNITAGTLGMVVRKDGKRMILSNAHVLADVNKGQPGDVILQPGSYDGGLVLLNNIAHLYSSVPIKTDKENGSNCPIAAIWKWPYNVLAKLFHRKTRLVAETYEPNYVDAALALPINDADVIDNILEIGVPVGFSEANIGDNVRKSGRTTGLTYGRIVATEASVLVDYGDDGTASFEHQLIASPMCEGGDSGSIVVNDGDAVVGLLFAGSPQTTVMNNIFDVMSALELDT